MVKKKKLEETDETGELEEEISKEETLETSKTLEPPEVGEQKVEGETPPARVKVGEKEFSPDELAKLVEKAEKVASIEKEQNVDIEQLYPDYTRKSQLLSDPVRLGAFIAEKYGTAKVLTPEEQVRQQAVKEAREVYGIVTKEDLEAFKKSFKEEMEVDQLLTDVTEIEKETGIPKTDILDFMRATKETDALKASEKISEYRKMSQGEVSEKPQPTFTEKSGSSGIHVPQGKKMPSIEDTEGMGKVVDEMLKTPSTEEE